MTAPSAAAPAPLAMQRRPVADRAGRTGRAPLLATSRSSSPCSTATACAATAGEATEGGVDLTGAAQGFTRSYQRPLPTQAQAASRRAARPALRRRNQIQITPVRAARCGARGSRLIGMLRDGHEEVKLSTPTICAGSPRGST